MGLTGPAVEAELLHHLVDRLGLDLTVYAGDDARDALGARLDLAAQRAPARSVSA